jgi:hypothetical protein
METLSLNTKNLSSILDIVVLTTLQRNPVMKKETFYGEYITEEVSNEGSDGFHSCDEDTFKFPDDFPTHEFNEEKTPNDVLNPEFNMDDDEFYDAGSQVRESMAGGNHHLFEEYNQQISVAGFEESKEGDDPPEREVLPWLRDPKVKFSLWTILKDSLGKELTRVTFPVYLSSPMNPL